MEIKKNVLTELRDGVLIVTLNREERRNAIDPDTANELEAIFNHAEKDPAVGALLITGAGERSFCAGEDLAALGENGECLTETEHGFAGITERLCPKPIVCACNGTAVAGGLEIALACDVIVAADHARFGLTEVKVGLLATSGGLVRLPKLIPAKIASEIVPHRQPHQRPTGL
jgi:crotonobetainyl-CoA hydratase